MQENTKQFKKELLTLSRSEAAPYEEKYKGYEKEIEEFKAKIRVLKRGNSGLDGEGYRESVDLDKEPLLAYK